MTDEPDKRDGLVDWLRQRGHTAEEIEKIIAKVDQYDAETVRESIFDSIDGGSFNLASLIDQALNDLS